MTRFTTKFAFVPMDKKLTTRAKLLYAEILEIAARNDQKYCFDTNEYLGKIFGVRRQTISNTVSELVKAGYLARDRGGLPEAGFDVKVRRLRPLKHYQEAVEAYRE